MQNNDKDILNEILNEVEKSRNSAEKSQLPETESTDSSNADDSLDKAANNEPQPEKKVIPDEGVKIRKATPNSSHNIKNNVRHTDAKTAKNIPQKKKKKKRKKSGSKIPGAIILVTLVLSISVCLSLVIIAYGKDMFGIGKSDTTQLIEIEEGSTTEEIALLLEEKGIIKSPKFFMLFTKWSGKESAYIAGEHFVRPNMAYETIIKELTTTEDANKESIAVTFPEGISIYEAADILEQDGICSADDFIFNFNAGGLGFEFEERITSTSNLKFNKMEGYIFPDTYFFYEGMEPEQVCQKIYSNFQKKMESPVEFNGKQYATRYERMEELNLTLDQLITFSSIVQQEAANTESMRIIASVFWNRLNAPEEFPKLQSDPTRLYAENVIKPHMAVYDQVIVDAYNTYEGVGLPPGAIGNPGTDAIDAVLEAYETETKYYYFYANVNTGITYYAATLEEHNANIEMVKQINEEAEAASNAAAQEGN